MTELAIEIREPLDLPMVQGFVGEEAADGLDDALEKLPNGATVFAWLDDLRIEGDISSKELLARCPGFVAPTGEQPWDNYFTIFVRGNVEITGVLEVNQYYDVYVRGNVRARSTRAISSPPDRSRPTRSWRSNATKKAACSMVPPATFPCSATSVAAIGWSTTRTGRPFTERSGTTPTSWLC